MNAFDDARIVEAEGIAILAPYLKERAHDGRFVLLNKGPMARHLQEVIGDAIMNSNPDRFWTIEIKVEKENKYKNLFLETWSNKNLDDRQSHAERGSNPGWLKKVRAELLFYYFLDQDELYVADMFKLKRWAFGHNGREGELWKYPEKRQGKRKQLNDTWARCVPIKVLQEAIGMKMVKPKQLVFPEMEEALF